MRMGSNLTWDEQVDTIVTALGNAAQSYKEAEDMSLMYIMDMSFERNAITRALHLLKDKFRIQNDNNR